jgi:hypothetical protein
MGSLTLLGGVVYIFVSGMLFNLILMKVENGLQSKLITVTLLLCGCYMIISAIGEIAPGV